MYVKAYSTFLICALVSAFGAWLLVSSHGSVGRNAGPFLLVVAGLGAVVIPMLMVSQERTKE